jgi:hypothetical protein
MGLRHGASQVIVIVVDIGSIEIIELDHTLRAKKIPPSCVETFGIYPQDTAELPDNIDVLLSRLRDSRQGN